MPDDPGPLLVERRITTGRSVDADRVTTDGRVWSWSTVDARLDDRGEWTFGTVESPAWREEGRLGADALDALNRAVRDGGFADAPTEFLPPVTVIHGSLETWTADVGGLVHVSTLHGRGVTEAPVLAALADALEAALASIDRG